ncbi:MAG TPA: Crp/Fnr family transcriptional regulator [Bacteroidales bacterium]|nr:Crp/Fnr family transcriptional regulator [Bacteroidales bacterium]
MVRKPKEYFCEKCLAGNETFLGHLDKADLSYINSQKTSGLYKKGEEIFLEGHASGGVFCLKEGKVKVYRQGSDGREHIIRIALPGEFIGLRALISGNNHTVSAAAFEDSSICFINKSDFFQLMIKYPDFTRNLIISLSRILEEAEVKMTSLAQKPVKERLAETLLFLSRSFRLDAGNPNRSYLSLTRVDLASIIGTVPETVIRLLSEFRDEGLVGLKGRRIYLLDPGRLKKIANLPS